jgi:hypothetical protein
MKLTKEQKFRLARARNKTMALLAWVDEIYNSLDRELITDDTDFIKTGYLNDYLVGEKVTFLCNCPTAPISY